MPPVRSNQTATDKREHRKVVIIGSGPAGHTAAIYAARAMLQPVMYEGFLAGGVAAGGQLTTTTDVENFPGFPEGISGTELTDKFRAQSEHLGAEIRTATIGKVDLSARPFRVWAEGDESDESKAVLADSVIVATGATAKRLHLPGEDRLWQRGISACAVCDGAAPIFRKKPLAVVGGGDTAAEEAIFLSKYAERVYLLVRRDRMRASKVMRARVVKHPKVKILYNTLPVEVHGDKAVTGLTVKSTIDGTTSELAISGLFYAIGHQPNTAPFAGSLKLDPSGYIVTHPGTTRTSVEGVFAAGDVQDYTYRQAITAAGSGCMAALEAERWLESQAEEAEETEPKEVESETPQL